MNYPIRTFVEIEEEELNQLKQTIIQQQAEIEHLKQLFGCDPAYFEPDTHPVKELTLTDELNQLLYSVNGDAYLGKDKEEALVKIVRKQYTEPVKEYKEPSVKEIDDLWLSVINNIPANDNRPREWHFARAILRKAQEK